MIPVDYDFISPAVRSSMVVPFNVPDWTALNLIPGGGPAASAYTRLIFGGQYFDVISKKAAYAEMRFCMSGGASIQGEARLSAFSTGPSGVEWVHCTPAVSVGLSQKNLGTDVTAQLNAMMAQTRYHQFMVQVKGEGILTMARLQVDWRVTHVVDMPMVAPVAFSALTARVDAIEATPPSGVTPAEIAALVARVETLEATPPGTVSGVFPVTLTGSVTI